MNKQRCLALRRRGCSIGQIAQLLGLSKSTVHWHVKEIRLTRWQHEVLRRQKRQLMAYVNARRRGQPIHPVEFYRPQWSKSLVHLVSHLSFDGRLDRYGCSYYNRSKSQARHVMRLMQTLLRINPTMRQRPSGIWLVSFYNVRVAAWLGERKAELLSRVRRKKSWRSEWLKALFDDEGHVHANGNVRRVRASQQAFAVLRTAQRFLASMGIRSRLDPGARAVEITGRPNLIRFCRGIGFSPGICVNGARKNGLWKESLEKRELVRLALQSYQHDRSLTI